MSDVNKEQLVSVAHELNSLFFKEPTIPTSGDMQVIEENVREAISDLLEKGDPLTENTIEIIYNMGFGEKLLELGFPVEPEPYEEEDLPEEEPPEDEPEEEPEVQDGATLEELKPPQPEPDPEDDLPGIPDNVDMDKLADIISDRMLEKRKLRKANVTATGESPYSLTIPIICKNPDLTVKEVCAILKDEHDVEIENKTIASVTAARSIVKRVVLYLKEFGIIPTEPAAKKPARSRTKKDD